MIKIVRSVFIFVLVAVLASCEYWNKDMLGYLEYWSSTVQVGRVDKSGATFQKNNAGIETIPVSATPTITAVLINPKGYELDTTKGQTGSGSSVMIDNASVEPLVETPVLSDKNTLFSVRLKAGDESLEHQTFTLTFEPVRTDNKLAVPGQSITLRYNTPPVAPIPVTKNDANKYVQVTGGQVWEADIAGNLYWAYDDSIKDEKAPNCAKWFNINGEQRLVTECKKVEETLDGLSIFLLENNYSNTSIAAVDSEGISSSTLTSGQTTPPATYIIRYDGNEATGGSVPNPQYKTQYTDIPLATNVGNLTKTGYRFSGWNTNKEGTGTLYAAGDIYREDKSLTLYAKWEVVNTVTFNANGGTGGPTGSIEVTYGQTPPGKLTDLPTRGNQSGMGETGVTYTFTGYNENAAGTGEKYYDKVGTLVKKNWKVTKNTTLYAQWELSGEASAVAEELEKITTPGTYAVKVTGEMASDQVYDIRDALLALKSNAPASSAWVELDLSGTNLTELKNYSFNPENNNKNAATNLTKVILPNTVTHIRSCVFDCCTNLTYVDLGSGVRYIGYQAFDFCYKLATIRVSASNPPTLDKEPFRLEGGESSYVSRTVEVPQASLPDYQSSPWANLKKVTIEAQ